MAEHRKSASHDNDTGDAIDDVLVGAPDHDQGGANAGAAYLMYVSEL